VNPNLLRSETGVRWKFLQPHDLWSVHRSKCCY